MKNVLFYCADNRTRSQMAEGLARHFIGHQYDVFSAGSSPADRVHPMATAVMAEIGIDISKQHPKPLTKIELSKIQLFITICADSEKPAELGGTNCKSWSEVEDPALSDVAPSEQIKKFRKVRDKLRQKVLALRAADQVW